MSNFHPLEIVDRGSETQVQVDETLTLPESSFLLPILFIQLYTLNNIGSSEGTFQYYYHATPKEPLQGSPRVA